MMKNELVSQPPKKFLYCQHFPTFVSKKKNFPNKIALAYGYSENVFSQDIDMNGHRIINLPDPKSNSEPVTKSYADTHYSCSGDAILQHACAFCFGVPKVFVNPKQAFSAVVVNDLTSYPYVKGFTQQTS